MKYQVNVILAAFNGIKYIEEQLNSIIDGDYPYVKVWVFDDGSTDGTDDFIREYEKKYPKKISFYKNTENKGLTKNFLEGVIMVSDKVKESSSTDQTTHYFMYSDQDDYWHKDKISRTLLKLRSTEKKYGYHKPIAVYTDALVVDENLGLMNASFHKSNNLDVTKTDLPHLLMENKLIGCTMMFNQELVKKLGNQLNDDIRYHDWWVALIAATFGHIGYLKESTISYRQHGKNIVGDQSFQKYVLNRLKNLKDQRSAIEKNILQAQLFYKIYGDSLNSSDRLIIKKFININSQNWFGKRVTIIKNGYLKTGFIRNFGLFICL
ncbi:MAG: glycosyltransferase [Anaerocolumna sp.]